MQLLIFPGHIGAAQLCGNMHVICIYLRGGKKSLGRNAHQNVNIHSFTRYYLFRARTCATKNEN